MISRSVIKFLPLCWGGISNLGCCVLFWDRGVYLGGDNLI